MDYLITFFEGIITFISPCLLPLLPVYLSFFAGQKAGNKRGRAVINASGFILGFTLIFVLLGAFAGTLGRFLTDYSLWVNLIAGLIVILFGLNYIGIIQLPFLNKVHQRDMSGKTPGFLSSLAFGIIFSISWTPCVGAFLGSALMLAASSGQSLRGILLLLSFSIGLGLPFLASAILMDQLKKAFDAIKRHYRVISLVSGSLLVVVGVLIATGTMGYFMSLLTF